MAWVSKHKYQYGDCDKNTWVGTKKNFFGIGPAPWTIDDIIYSTDMESVQHRRKPTM